MALDTSNFNPSSITPPETGSISDPSGSMEIEIDFLKLLSLAGINLPNIPPTGSIPSPPKKVKFLDFVLELVPSLY